MNGSNTDKIEIAINDNPALDAYFMCPAQAFHLLYKQVGPETCVIVWLYLPKSPEDPLTLEDVKHILDETLKPVQKKKLLETHYGIEIVICYGLIDQPNDRVVRATIPTKLVESMIQLPVDKIRDNEPVEGVYMTWYRKLQSHE